MTSNDNSNLKYEELDVVVNCAENVPKKIHLIAYKNILDLREDFKDELTTSKFTLSLPELSRAKDLINDIMSENKELALVFLDNTTQISCINEMILNLENKITKLSDQIEKLRNELSDKMVEKYYNRYISDTKQKLESLEKSVLAKDIGFNEFFKEYEDIKSQLITQQILHQIYN